MALRGLVRAVYRDATTVAGAIGAATGAHPTDITALRLLDAAADRPTMGHLASALGLSSAATTGLVDRLERAGMARRVPDPDDRRRIHVEITERAHAVAAEVLAPLGARIDAAIAATPRRDRAAVAAFLRRLVGDGGDERGADGPPAGPSTPARSRGAGA